MTSSEQTGAYFFSPIGNNSLIFGKGILKELSLYIRLVFPTIKEKNLRFVTGLIIYISYILIYDKTLLIG